MNKLYPLKFTPILKEKIWGGNKLMDLFDKKSNKKNIGESWEISSIQDNISIIENGFLEGNDLEELIEIYMGDLVGDKVYEQYGIEFPLLFKFIDAQADLSLQVHPDDQMAKKLHHSYGKNELWYVLDAKENAEIIVGFNREVSKEEYAKLLNEGDIQKVLNKISVKPGDCFFIPSGRIHSIGAGVVLAEIQQSSDVTYRIYDWDRVDENGNKRELHTQLALEAINFDFHENYSTVYNLKIDEQVNLLKCSYFTTNILHLTKSKKLDYEQLDSFVVYVCIEGTCEIKTSESITKLNKGETLLIPACFEQIEILPNSNTKILETYIS